MINIGLKEIAKNKKAIRYIKIDTTKARRVMFNYKKGKRR